MSALQGASWFCHAPGLALPVLRRGEGFGLGLGLGSRPPPSAIVVAAAAGGSSQDAAGDGVAGCPPPRMTGEKAAPGEPVAAGSSAEEMTVPVPAKEPSSCHAEGRWWRREDNDAPSRDAQAGIAGNVRIFMFTAYILYTSCGPIGRA